MLEGVKGHHLNCVMCEHFFISYYGDTPETCIVCDTKALLCDICPLLLCDYATHLYKIIVIHRKRRIPIELYFLI